MSDKSIVLYDNIDSKDSSNLIYNTSIDIKCHETGEYIFKGLKNKVVISGSGIIARKLFDLGSEDVIPSYNDSIPGYYQPSGIDTTAISTKDKINNSKVLLFCCGMDGCGDQNSQVYPVNYTSRIDPIPFRFQTADIDLSSDLRDVYFGRAEKTVNDNNFIAYYFKKFDSVKLVQKWSDGNDVTSTVYDQDGSAETYVEITLSITKEDFRDYFNNASTIEQARINCISLCSAYPCVNGGASGDGFIYYQDIKPLTRLNFPNESLIDISKGIDIIYHVYM